MRFSAGRALSIAAAAAIACAWVAPTAGAAEPFDNLPGETLNDTPYTSAAVFDRTTPQFDTTDFTEQPAEISSPTVYLGCGSWGAKDAWVRFATAVKGNLFVEVTAANFNAEDDLFYNVYKAPTTNPAFSDLTEIDCDDGRSGPLESYAFGYAAPANTVLFVQVLMQCKAGEALPACNESERRAAPGGRVQVRLRFTPDNKDGDSLPDTLDPCPDVAGAYRGCPDRDGDGVGEADDRCPTVFGRAPDGCRLPDEDGDGYAATALGGNDCNDDNASIHPGANDIPRNQIDENCDGRDSNYPRIHNVVYASPGFGTRLGRTVGFLAPFKIGGLLAEGTVVRVRCQGRGCPVPPTEAKRVRKSRHGLRIGRALVGKRLAPHAKVTLTITRRGYIGEAKRYIIPKHGKLEIQNLCIPVGTRHPRKKCR
jgi:hypothetical protein